MRRILMAAFALLVVPSAFTARAAERGQTTFVGCPSDGQVGPIAAPGEPARMPRLAPDAARRLAYYASNDLAVLAPRGWRCVGLYGSNLSALIVMPGAYAPLDFLDRNVRLAGPAVGLQHIFGGTSGRFPAAKIAARMFPAAKSFVESVIKFGPGPILRDAFPFGPFPTDQVRRLSDTVAEFTTPGGLPGIGTAFGWLRDDSQPIRGAIIWLPNDDNDIVKVDTRLPAGSGDIAAIIVRAVERDLGRPFGDRQ